MLSYLLKKSFIFSLSLLAVVTITFFMMKAIPGDPFINEIAIPKEVLKSLYKHYGLDKPLFVQYLKYLKGIIHFDLGPSLVYQGRSVTQIILKAFPVTFVLGLQTFFLSLFWGLSLGIYSALKKAKWQDNTIGLLSSIVISIPNFLLASLLQYLFSVKLSLLPVARWESFAHTILPTLALSALPAAYMARLVKTSMLDVLSQDYIRTAYAKGLPFRKIILKHTLKNSFLPVLGYITPLITYLMTGSFVVERIFAIPGLGQWMIASIQSRDYSTILGLVVFYCAILLLVQFVVDILYAILDPRLRRREA